jgi:hypothetical protein
LSSSFIMPRMLLPLIRANDSSMARLHAKKRCCIIIYEPTPQTKSFSNSPMTRKKTKGRIFALRQHTQTHRRILGVAGNIILAPVNQWLVMGQIIWSLPNPGFEPVTFR